MNISEINHKSSLDIGDRVLAHNGQTGTIIEMDENVVVIACTRRILSIVSADDETVTIVATEYDRIVSPRASVLTCESDHG